MKTMMQRNGFGLTFTGDGMNEVPNSGGLLFMNEDAWHFWLADSKNAANMARELCQPLIRERMLEQCLVKGSFRLNFQLLISTMKKLIYFAALFSGFVAFGEDVVTLEAGLKSDIMDLVNQVNPIVQTTGKRKYISFAFISDFHKCKRVPGDDAASNPVKDYWYGSAGCLTESEQTIRLLGSVAADAGLDAVICGGDFSTAPVMGAQGFTVPEYTNEIFNVKAMFNTYLPSSVPLFTVDGNHDRCYGVIQLTDSEWAYVLTNFNTSVSTAAERGVYVTYHRDIAGAKLGDNATGTFTGNTFNLDFRRLFATKGYNVRICCLGSYDSANGSDYPYRVYDAAQMYDSNGTPLYGEMTPSNTIIGMIAHGSEEKPAGKSEMVRYAAGDLLNGFMNGYSNAKTKTGPWNRGERGMGFFGLVSAHFHFTNGKNITNTMDSQVNPDNSVYASAISVASAYAVNEPSKPSNHQLGTDQAYHFSIFVIDPDSNLMREIRVGGWTTNPVVHENPVVQLHATNIRSNLSQPPAPPAPTAPAFGTVTVSPAVSNVVINGVISSVGNNGATACDVYLSLNGAAPLKIATDATNSFNYDITGLAAETTYSYMLSISNNAATVMGTSRNGSFTTHAAQTHVDPDPPVVNPPAEDPEEAITPVEGDNAPTIQAAIDAVAATHGTVILGSGLFTVNTQLMITNGVTLAGQGYEKTVLKYAGSKDQATSRVATINGGATLSHVAVTGGKQKHTGSGGGGVIITGSEGGTVSWCCITNNYAQQHAGGGIGITGTGIVRIDHTIVADNSAATGLASTGGGIGMRPGTTGLQVEIKACLVQGNSVGSTSCGAGIGIMYKKIADGSGDLSKISVLIRNTTITGNSVTGTGTGGGLYTTQNNLILQNCIIADNTASSNDNISYLSDAVESTATLTNCLIDTAAGFVGGGDYHLTEGSAAIGQGMTYDGIGKDLDGKDFSNPPSIGCYEFGVAEPESPTCIQIACYLPKE